MPRKSKIIADIPEDRILQIANDVAEGVASGTKPELRAVIQYFQKALDKEVQRTNVAHMSVAMLVLGQELVDKHTAALRQWLEQLKKDRGT